MRPARWHLLFVLLAALAVLGGCECAQLPEGALFACKDQADCRDDEVCSEGYCRPAVGDAAVPLDGAVPGADAAGGPADASSDPADASLGATDAGLDASGAGLDAASAQDSGVPVLDASTVVPADAATVEPRDASTLPGPDAATIEPPDAAAQPSDAAAQPADAAAQPPDAAAQPPDAAAQPPDAAAPGPDASAPQPSDAGFECVPACPSDRVCSLGSCVCPSGKMDCNGPCQTCCEGSSSWPCATTEVCLGGQCVSCGAMGLPCCPSGCGAGLGCISGACRPCGDFGQPCCPGVGCNANQGRCAGGTCLNCGDLNTPCCPDGKCMDGISACSNGTCSPCGIVNQPCCDGYGCDGDACCGAAGYCVKAGDTCDTDFTCCKSFASYSCPKSCVNTKYLNECGGLNDPCCTRSDPLGNLTFYCSETGTVCGGWSVTCVSCGVAGLPCCDGSVCTDPTAGCVAGNCVPCGAVNGPCCPGMACNGGCCNPITRRCEALGSACGGWGTCDEAGRCATCGNLYQACCSNIACFPDYVCSSYGGTCQ